MSRGNRRSWVARLVVVAALLAALAGAFTFSADSASAAAPAPKSAQSTCVTTAWYRVAGPAQGFSGTASYNVYLYASEDVTSRQFCGYLHTSLDYSTGTGCYSFSTAVYNTDNGGRYSTVGSGQKCNTTGSIQSTFYHVPTCAYYAADGWINSFPTAERSTAAPYFCPF